MEGGSMTESLFFIIVVFEDREAKKILSVSDEISRFGYASSDFVSGALSFVGIIHPDDRARFLQRVGGCHDTQCGKGAVEFRIFTREGEVVWISCRLVRQPEAAGGGVEACLADVTPIREQQEQFYETIPLPYQSLDADGTVLYVNRKWLEVMGYGKKEVVGQRFDTFFLPEKRHLFQEKFAQFKEAGRVNGDHYLLQQKGGGVITVAFNGEIERDKEGNYLRSHCVLENITEKALQDARFKELHDRYKRFSKNFHGIVYRATIDFVPEYIDGQVETITGYDKAAFLEGRATWEELIHPDDRHKVFDHFEQMKHEPGFSLQLSYRIIKKEGSVGVVRESVCNIADEHGNPAMVEGIVYDITEEAALHNTLEFGKKYLQTVLDTDTNLIATTLKGEKLQGGNRSLFTFFGYENIEAFHKEHNCICEFFEPVDKEGFVKESMDGVNWLDYILKNPEIFHKVLIKKEGEAYIFSIKANRMPFDEKQRSVVVLADITRLEAYKDSLERQVHEEIKKRQGQEQLLINQSKIAAMGEMMSAVAHHWRQPLNIIALQVQDVKYAYSLQELDEAYVERFVHIAMREIQFMTKTIDDFRNFFKAEDTFGPFDAYEQIKTAENILAGSLKNQNIDLEIEHKSLSILGRPSEFVQVIINALVNAKDAILRFRDADPRYEGSIRIALHEDESKKQLFIRDNGGGIDDGIIDKIFEPYFTTKFQSRGTGISLYMSKIIIERNMNGSIYVRNIDGGSEFVIEFDKSDKLNPQCEL